MLKRHVVGLTTGDVFYNTAIVLPICNDKT